MSDHHVPINLDGDRVVSIGDAPQQPAPIVPVGCSELLDEALQALSRLSTAAQAANEQQLMYAANRAWRELDVARRDSGR